MAIYALCAVYLNHFQALGYTRYAFVLGGVLLLQQALFVAMHSSGPQIVTVQVIAAATLLVASELLDRLRAPLKRSGGRTVASPTA
jgi:hypothetical protein